MQRIIALLAISVIFMPMILTADETGHEEKTIKIQTWSYSDPALDELDYNKGDPCGEFLSLLMGSGEKYQLLATTGIQGPPGIVYTLQNHKGEIAIVKCGTSGGCSHDTGGGEH